MVREAMLQSPGVTIPEAFQIALEHHRAGRLAEAEGIYRQILAAEPCYADALHFLGVIAHQSGRHDLAVELIGKAIAVKPEYAEAHNNLGVALSQQGRLNEAMVAYRRALEIRPDHAESHNNLGNALKGAGRSDEAIAAYLCALQHKPDDAMTRCNLGTALMGKGCLDEAMTAFRRAIQLKPDYAEAHIHLGIALRDQGDMDAASTAFRRALELNPCSVEAHSNLASLLRDQGCLDEAIAAYRRAIQIKPDDAGVHSNLVYTLHFHPGYDDRTIAEEHKRWNVQFADPLKQSILEHPNDRNSERRLRIGYVSPDFRKQSEAFFVVPLLEAHDHSQFEIHCYASVAQSDDVTGRLHRCADVWHDVLGRSDHEVAEQVRRDRIDILVDLTMHMADNRLLVFARKPAPVQVAWLAYPGSTGLEAIDHRFTDSYMDPPSVNSPYSSENPVRLPDCWVSYHPLTVEPLVNPLPAANTGHVTFGCLNNFCKVNDPMLELWAGVLRTVEGSRLLLLVPEGSLRQRILDKLSRHGIHIWRIEFTGRLPRNDYLKLHHRIDIALDTLPYNGITTSCDAFWMGVPVVSLVGNTAAGRVGLGILSLLDLPELAARTADEFVRAAERLAGNLPRLAELREGLRLRMESSSLMDAPRFARNVEAAFREMWRAWCAGSQPRNRHDHF